MTSREFCYWLQGFFEIQDAGIRESQNVDVGLTSDRAKVIKKHLALVFKHEIDPSYPNQQELDKIHNGQAKPDGKVMRC
jgi:hypothetical protein